MPRQGERWVALGGGAALAASLWLLWFHRSISGGFVGLPGVSGWRALGASVGAVVLVTGLVGVASAWWRPISGAVLVLLGALALLAAITAAVNRIGVEGPVTTSPSIGLTIGFVGAALVVLAGIASLLRR